MESIYNKYQNNEITLEQVYEACKRFQTKEDALVSATLTLITVHPSKYMLRRYERVYDALYHEPELIYNKLYEESPRLAHKFTKQFGHQTLIHPVLFHWRYDAEY